MSSNNTDSRLTIDSDNADQLAYWAKELNIKPEQLLQIIGQIGNVVDDVRLEMSKKSR